MTAALSRHPHARGSWDSEMVSRIVCQSDTWWLGQSVGLSFRSVPHGALLGPWFEMAYFNNSWSMYVTTKASVFLLSAFTFLPLLVSFHSSLFPFLLLLNLSCWHYDWYGNYIVLALIYLAALLVAAPTTILGCRNKLICSCCCREKKKYIVKIWFETVCSPVDEEGLLF